MIRALIEATQVTKNARHRVKNLARRKIEKTKVQREGVARRRQLLRTTTAVADMMVTQTVLALTHRLRIRQAARKVGAFEIR